MNMRSWLFVPGDSERKINNSANCGADAVIFDLEDSVAPNNKEAARKRVANHLGNADRNSRPALWVRVNPLGSRHCAGDLDRIVPAGPDGIVLPKANGVRDVHELARRMGKLEESSHEIPVVAIATETALGVANLGGYVDRPQRLVALTWGAEDLATALDADVSRDSNGAFSPLFAQVRTQFRLAAAAADLPAIDTIYANFDDMVGLAAYAQSARRTGFRGMLAIHPTQVAIINDAFTPNPDEVAEAQRIVTAFADGAGVVSMDGRMLDRPHLLRAQRTLAIAEDLQVTS